MDYYVNKKDLKGDEKDLVYIQDDIYYVPKKTKSKIYPSGILSRPNLYKFCEFCDINIRYDGLQILNLMGLSTQVVARQSFVTDQAIIYDFPHCILDTRNAEDFIFKLSQMEYNIYYCLDYYKNHGPEHRPYSFYVFEYFFNSMKNGKLTLSRLSEPVAVDMEKVLKYSDDRVKNQWKLMSQFDLNSFNELSDESMLAYYLCQTKAKDYIYDKFNDRQYGDMIENISQQDIDYILNELKKLKLF